MQTETGTPAELARAELIAATAEKNRAKAQLEAAHIAFEVALRRFQRALAENARRNATR